MIYLASPYTHDDPAIRQARFEAACRAVVHLVRRGEVVFSPVVHSHPLALRGLRGDWYFWEPTDRAFLACAKEVRILKLDGWRESVGVTAERQIAVELGKPISFMEAVDDESKHNADPFYAILDRMARLHERKAKDYGTSDDPYANVRSAREFGLPEWLGAILKANDKINRFKAFARKQELTNEPAEDSFLDLANYAVIGLVLYEEGRTS